MDKVELTRTIKRFALEEAGFDLAGVTRAELPGHHASALRRWVEEGMAGSMEYMTRSGDKRAHPETSLPSARSVISLALNYFHAEDQKPPAGPVGKVAKYAYGGDYHKIIEKKLKRLSKFILETAGPAAEVKTYVDTGPVLERAFAEKAGLGFFGKNTNLITRHYGSWVFLANVLTNLELEVDEPFQGSCGSCRICLDACPTGALLGDYRLDARRCISYLTIEAKEEIPAALREGVGGWVFGCDVCQDVCPYNHRAKETKEKELSSRKAGTWIALEEITDLKTDADFQKRFEGSPLKRPKRKGLQRNAEVVRGNIDKTEVARSWEVGA